MDSVSVLRRSRGDFPGPSPFKFGLDWHGPHCLKFLYKICPPFSQRLVDYDIHKAGLLPRVPRFLSAVAYDVDTGKHRTTVMPCVAMMHG
jgi:hypothetical protein